MAPDGYGPIHIHIYVPVTLDLIREGLFERLEVRYFEIGESFVSRDESPYTDSHTTHSGYLFVHCGGNYSKGMREERENSKKISFDLFDLIFFFRVLAPFPRRDGFHFQRQKRRDYKKSTHINSAWSRKNRL